MLGGRGCLRIDIHRRTQGGMPHQFLHYFEFGSDAPEKRGVRALLDIESWGHGPDVIAKNRGSPVRSSALVQLTRNIWSMKSDTASSLRSRRCWGLLAAGSALRNASRTIRRCTLNFRDTPAIVPTPNSNSRRICSKSSTLSHLVSQLRFRCPSTKRTQPPLRWAKVNCHGWAKPECRNHPTFEVDITALEREQLALP